MADNSTSEQWPSGGSVERIDQSARNQKLIEIVIGSATAIALGVGCFFLGKFLLGNQPTRTDVAGKGGEKSAPVTRPSEATAAATTGRPAARPNPATAGGDVGGRGDAVATAQDPAMAEGTPDVRELTAVEDIPAERGAATTGRTTAGGSRSSTAATGSGAATSSRTAKGDSTAGKTAGKATSTAAGARSSAARASEKSGGTKVAGDSVGKTSASRSSNGMRVESPTVCTAIKDRNPEGKAAAFAVSSGKIFCWMRVTNGEGRKVRCIWTLNGKRYEGVWLEVGSPSWRTWASKKLASSMRGKGKVAIEAEDGTVLGTVAFEIK